MYQSHDWPRLSATRSDLCRKKRFRLDLFSLYSTAHGRTHTLGHTHTHTRLLCPLFSRYTMLKFRNSDRGNEKLSCTIITQDPFDDISTWDSCFTKPGVNSSNLRLDLWPTSHAAPHKSRRSLGVENPERTGVLLRPGCPVSIDTSEFASTRMIRRLI